MNNANRVQTAEKWAAGRGLRAYQLPASGPVAMSAGECWLHANPRADGRPPRGKLYRQGLKRWASRRWLLRDDGTRHWVVPSDPYRGVQV